MTFKKEKKKHTNANLTRETNKNKENLNQMFYHATNYVLYIYIKVIHTYINEHSNKNINNLNKVCI